MDMNSGVFFSELLPFGPAGPGLLHLLQGSTIGGWDTPCCSAVSPPELSELVLELALGPSSLVILGDFRVPWVSIWLASCRS